MVQKGIPVMKRETLSRKLPVALMLCLGLFVAVLPSASPIVSAETAQHRLLPVSSRPAIPVTPPTLTSVSPSQAYNYHATAVTITGASFVATPTITLGSMLLVDVTFVSSTTLTATVPADLPGGIHTITVTNPDGQSTNLTNTLTIHRRMGRTDSAAPRGVASHVGDIRS